MKLSELIIAYLKSGLYSFSASANAVLHEELVEKRAYLTEEEYLRMMSVGALIPGPFHVNLVIATGYGIGGVKGALLAVGAFILPGFLVAVCTVIALHHIPEIGTMVNKSGVATGMLAAVAGLILSVVVKLLHKQVHSLSETVAALMLCGTLLWQRVPFPLVILTTGASFLIVALMLRRR